MLMRFKFYIRRTTVLPYLFFYGTFLLSHPNFEFFSEFFPFLFRQTDSSLVKLWRVE